MAEFALALVAVWVVAAVCAICLNALGSDASVVVAAATAPLVVAFLARGARADDIGSRRSSTVAACFVIRMLGENFRMFAEIVRSRFAIAEKTARRRGGEAGGDGHRADRRSDRAAQPALLSGPARRPDQARAGDRRPFAVGLIDLDGFKPVNDMHGHPAGDEILRQVADRLARAMDGRGSAARMGGDEFAILCDGIGARDEAIALGEEIQAIFATPFAVERLDIALTGACGFALFPSSAAEPDELVRLADAALYRAKAIGRGGVAVFDATSESRRRAGARALRRAVDRIRGSALCSSRSSPLTTGRIGGFDRFRAESLRARADRSPASSFRPPRQTGATSRRPHDRHGALVRPASRRRSNWPCVPDRPSGTNSPSTAEGRDAWRAASIM